MKLSDVNQKIIHAVIKKAETVCPGSLALIGVYGSVCTGDIHDKSDLDLMILINDDAGWQLSDGFIIDDNMVGYDIYCTTWNMLEEEAQCRHAHLAKLMDSEIVYVADRAAVSKWEELKSRADLVLKSEKRFECVDNLMKDAKKVYADTMLAETISKVRLYASYCIELLLNAVMIENRKYFHRGVKRTFEELEGLPLPIGFVDNIYSVITASETAGLKRSLTGVIAFCRCIYKT